MSVRREEDQFFILMVFCVMFIWHVKSIRHLDKKCYISIICTLSLKPFNVWNKYLETYWIKMFAFKLGIFYESQGRNLGDIIG